MKQNFHKSFQLNLAYAFIAQFLSMAISILMTLLIPRVLGVREFAYWQLFIFYCGYVGLLHFGIPDGIYLRYGGVELTDMDAPMLSAELHTMLAADVLIAVLTAFAISATTLEPERKYVWFAIAFYMVLANAFWFLGYLFQAANLTRYYSSAMILFKGLFFVGLLVLLCAHVRDFRPYVGLYTFAQFLGLAFLAYRGRPFVFTTCVPDRKALGDLLSNCRTGLILTVSNLASGFVLGIGRVMVDAAKGISTFGIISLALSMTNFFLQFIAQVSMVLFPALRQVRKENLFDIFLTLRDAVSYPLCAILALYAPMQLILLRLLPQYEESFRLLAILLPICVFDGKMQLLNATYFKVLRKERALMAVNLGTLAFSAVVCYIGAFVSGNMAVVAGAMTLSIAVRSVVSNYYLSSLMNAGMGTACVWEILLSLLFMFSSYFGNPWASFSVYLSAFLLYLRLTRDRLRHCLSLMKKFREQHPR